MAEPTRRERVIRLRCTDEQAERWTQAAAERGLSLSEYAREALDGAGDMPVTAALRTIRAALRRAGAI